MSKFNQILVTKYSSQTVLVMGLSDHKVYYISTFNIDEDPLGTVYLGRIEKKLSNIGSSFVMYEKGKTGFIKLNNNKCSDILPVMKKSLSSEDKKDIFTDEIEVSDDYAVIKRGSGCVSVSKKVDRKLRLLLIETYENLAKREQLDILIRTLGAKCEEDEFVEKINALKSQLDLIYQKSETRTVYSVLYKPLSEYIKETFSLITSEEFEIITDDESIYNELCDFYDSDVCTKSCCIKMYDDKQVSMKTLYGMKAKLSEATAIKVNLKSGASMFIESTNALTAIDVNSASTYNGKNKEELFLNVNIEAANEAVRQIKLRNISGIIMIDFINMKSDESYDILQAEVKRLLAGDSVQSRLCDVTSLGLFEISRKRVRLSLEEQLKSVKGERLI